MQGFTTLSKDSTISTAVQFQIGRAEKPPTSDRPAGIWDYRDITNSKDVVIDNAFAEEDMENHEQPGDEFELTAIISEVGRTPKNDGSADDKRWNLCQDKMSELPRKTNEEAEARHVQAMEWKEKALGTMHLHTLMSTVCLALVLQSDGKYKEAERMHRPALHKSATVHNLGMCWRAWACIERRQRCIDHRRKQGGW